MRAAVTVIIRCGWCRRVHRFESQTGVVLSQPARFGMPPGWGSIGDWYYCPSHSEHALQQWRRTHEAYSFIIGSPEQPG